MWRKLFVGLFFGLTLLPGLQMLTGAVSIPAVDEKRVLAPTPSRETPLDQWPRVVDRWFSDHFGLRDLMIRLKTQLDLSLFGVSDRVWIGKSGQLFYRSVIDIEEPAMDQALVTVEAPAIDGLKMLSLGLKRSGIRLALIVNMMSDRFYPELLPASVPRRPQRPRIDDFIDRLRDIPDVVYIDSKAILQDTMRTRRVFHKTDFHWNEPAAFDIAKALVDRMSVDEGRATSAWTQSLDISTRRLSGGIATFMPVFAPPVETALFVDRTWDWPRGFERFSETGIFEESTRSDVDPSLLPPTVFVGDSFLDGMLTAGLEACFVETHRTRWISKVNKISEITAHLPPDTRWLVLQFIEISQTAVRALADQKDIEAAVQALNTRRGVALEP